MRSPNSMTSPSTGARPTTQEIEIPQYSRRMVLAVSVLQVCSIVVVDPAIYPLAETRDVLIAVGVLAPLVLLLAVAPARQLVRRLREDIPLETGPPAPAPARV